MRSKMECPLQGSRVTIEPLGIKLNNSPALAPSEEDDSPSLSHILHGSLPYVGLPGAFKYEIHTDALCKIAHRFYGLGRVEDKVRAEFFGGLQPFFLKAGYHDLRPF